MVLGVGSTIFLTELSVGPCQHDPKYFPSAYRILYYIQLSLLSLLCCVSVRPTVCLSVLYEIYFPHVVDTTSNLLISEVSSAIHTDESSNLLTGRIEIVLCSFEI